MLLPEQAAQEEEYAFPYHYIASFSANEFRHALSDSWAINYASTIEFILDRLQQISFSSIVDVGCGDGRITREIACRFPQESVFGLDYSSRAISLAKSMNVDIQTLRFLKHDVTVDGGLPTFDAALLIEVLEHIPIEDTETFLNGVHRLLAPAGTLLLTVPHANKPLEYKHFRHFTVDTLRDAMQTKFDIKEIIPFERLQLSSRLIGSLLVNRFFILNHKRLLNAIYQYHKSRLFFCASESECQRIFIQAVAR